MNVCPFVSDKVLNNSQAIEITTLEKVRLRRVANSFSVQIPTTEFIVNPVQSLFQSFLGTDHDSKSHFVNGYMDSFIISEERNLSGCDLNMII